MEINTLIYHLNKEFEKQNKPFKFTREVLEPTQSIRFNVVSQENDILTIKPYNNETLTIQDLKDKQFKFGDTIINIYKVEFEGKTIRLGVNYTKPLPKKTYEIIDKIYVLLTYGYRFSTDLNRNTYQTNKRINFTVSIPSDPQGLIYDELLNSIEQIIYRHGKTFKVYDQNTNTLSKNTYINITTNVITTLHYNNRDNVSKIFYVMTRTYKKSN